MIKQIGHTAYVVKDMEASVRFYCDVLGFTKAFETRKENGDPWIVYIKINDHKQFIELFYGGETTFTSDSKTIGFSHLCLEVEDIEQTATHLRAQGVTLDVNPKLGRDGNWQCWARDPDGNRIEFMQLNPGSPQMKA